MKLAEYAKTQPAKKIDKMAALPKRLRKEVDEGLDAGIAYTAISRWLKTKGHPVSETVILRYHRKKGH